MVTVRWTQVIFSLLSGDKHELSVPVEEVLSADGLQLRDGTEGPRREPQVSVWKVDREAGDDLDALDDGGLVRSIRAPTSISRRCRSM